MADILLETSDSVATITFDRPQRRNAFTVEISDRRGDTPVAAAADPQVRRNVFGTGAAFLAGLDLVAAAGQADRLDSFDKRAPDLTRE